MDHVANPDDLHTAVEQGDFATVNRLLNQQREVLSSSEYLRFLNAVDEGDETAIINAARSGHEAIVRLLLEEGANPASAIYHAAYNNHVSIVALLLEHGEDINAMGIYDTTILEEAAAGLSFETVHMLLQKGAKTERPGGSSLCNACCREYEEYEHAIPWRLGMIEDLLAHGADVNACDASGHTPLHEAVLWDYPQVIRLLLESGANVNAQGYDGSTALYLAATCNCTSVVPVLLEYHANPYLKTKPDNQTAREAAIARRHIFSESNYARNYAREVKEATTHGYDAIIAMLERAEAETKAS